MNNWCEECSEKVYLQFLDTANCKICGESTGMHTPARVICEKHAVLHKLCPVCGKRISDESEKMNP